jgi:hypothetical protein
MSDSSPTQPPNHLRWSGMTHPGRVRQNNEDTFLCLNFDARELRYLGKSANPRSPPATSSSP